MLPSDRPEANFSLSQVKNMTLSLADFYSYIEDIIKLKLCEKCRWDGLQIESTNKICSNLIQWTNIYAEPTNLQSSRIKNKWYYDNSSVGKSFQTYNRKIYKIISIVWLHLFLFRRKTWHYSITSKSYDLILPKFRL
jgi:hypothetical protein